MANTARAYQPKRRYEEMPRPRPRIEVHPGQDRRVDAERYSRAMALFKLVIALVALLAVVGFTRVWFISASVDVLTQMSEVESSIEAARTEGSSLDAQYYAASSTSSVMTYASEKLGMVASEATPVEVDLTPDYVPSLLENVYVNILTMEAEAVIAADMQSGGSAAE